MIHFKCREDWLEGCIYLMKGGVTFEAFEPDGTCAMFYIKLTGGY